MRGLLDILQLYPTSFGLTSAAKKKLITRSCSVTTTRGPSNYSERQSAGLCSRFKRLGATVMSNNTIDAEITNRLQTDAEYWFRLNNWLFGEKVEEKSVLGTQNAQQGCSNTQ